PLFTPRRRHTSYFISSGGLVFVYKRNFLVEALLHDCLPHAISLGKAVFVIADRFDSAEELVARVRQYFCFSPTPWGRGPG
ncbi:hypothetical protein ACVGWW_08455, partial [Enterobacter hormaechei]